MIPGFGDIPRKSIFIFFHTVDGDLHAIEGTDSDSALIECARVTGWNIEGIVYLGSLDGTLPRSRHETAAC